MGQFLVVLPGTDPLVWRRILVPEAYSFWYIHVAIQDAMGWKPPTAVATRGASPVQAPARPRTWAAREATSTSCRSSKTPSTRSMPRR